MAANLCILERGKKKGKKKRTLAVMDVQGAVESPI
jgi:hypothetical protein